MSAPIARYSFLSWARRGIGVRISDIDTLGASAAAHPTRASVPISLEVNHAARIDRHVSLYGPGDVRGFDQRAIVRTDPRPNVMDFEPNYLVTLDLYDEELPWRYTPARATTEQRLRPWIALIVLADGEFERQAGMSAIRVADADALFPPPTQIWAWAHVHLNASLAHVAEFDSAVSSNPDDAFARLVSPRRLKPNTAYNAFVVPTFETGRLAGVDVDLPAELDGAKPAWGAGQDLFPVYYEWSFRTGAGGDFESLIRLLEPRAMDPRVGSRDIDVTAPAPGLITGITNPSTLKLEGALRSPQTESTIWPRMGETFPAELAALIKMSSPSGCDQKRLWPSAVPASSGQTKSLRAGCSRR